MVTLKYSKIIVYFTVYSRKSLTYEPSLKKCPLSLRPWHTHSTQEKVWLSVEDLRAAALVLFSPLK